MSTFSSRRALIKGAAALTVAGALGAHHAGEQGAQAATLDVKTTPLTFKITEASFDISGFNLDYEITDLSAVLDFGMYTPYLQIGYYTEVRLPETSSWPDVKTDDPNYAAYIWARQKGITFGWSDGNFHANASISNATVAAFLYRFDGKKPVAVTEAPYTDVKVGSAFYREILWDQQNKVVLNTSSAFDAQYLVTHGELETLIEAFQARAK